MVSIGQFSYPHCLHLFTKNMGAPCLLTRSNPLVLLFPPTYEKISERKRFGDLEKAKRKSVRALNGIKLDQFRICLQQRKRFLDCCNASNEEHFTIIDFLTSKVDQKNLYNQISVAWSPQVFLSQDSVIFCSYFAFDKVKT